MSDDYFYQKLLAYHERNVDRTTLGLTRFYLERQGWHFDTSRSQDYRWVGPCGYVYSDAQAMQMAKQYIEAEDRKAAV